MKRKAYLKKTSLKRAQEILLKKFGNYKLQTENIKTEQAQGRVTAEAVYAQRSAPDYYASAMDGIAVKAFSTNYASEREPVILTKGQDFVYVDTGDLVPEPFNAVIKIEDVEKLEDKRVEIIQSVPVWNHIRSIGESVIKQQMIIPSHTEVNVFEIGSMLEAGVTELEVFKKPELSIIPTGSELVKPDEKKEKGQLVDFNSTMLKLTAQNWGLSVNDFAIVKDNYEEIKSNILKAVDSSDIIIVNAGSSAGREDYTLDILQSLGEVYVHGVDVMPGKPLIIAKVKGKAVFGIPGYPLSALLDLHLFVKPLVKNILGLKYVLPNKLRAKVKKKVPSTAGLKEFIRVNLAEIEGELLALPQKRGSASMHSLVNADGILPIPESKEGILAEEEVDVYLLKSKEVIKNNLMMIGSHDLTIDIIRDLIRKNKYDFALNIQSVGSLSGLVSLKRGESHLAGAHLLDSESGEYNTSYIKDLLQEEIAVINLVQREQGLMVKKGNPKGIKDIKDLTNDNLKFINRQRGSGTRVLLDYLLKNENIDKNKIKGYDKEELTHMGVAVQVAEGNADTALGIKAAAAAVGIDFVPIKEEKYDIILKKSELNDDRIDKIIKIIKSDQFKEKVKMLGGYNTKESGNIHFIE
ncbi:MAG TPA: molybdopterin biosynthesis protein [Halanaerobiales bacterium]|nr:molybdopterin biosynthesis protein [Halanaerobiales bacterium]